MREAKPQSAGSPGKTLGQTLAQEGAPTPAQGPLLNPKEDPDWPLLQAVARGEEAAARALMDRHLGRVLGTARRLLPAGNEAEDIAQEVFLRVWKHAASWQPGRAKFATWIVRVALNLCYDRLRRNRVQYTDEVPDRADERAGADEEMIAEERAAAVHQALSNLPQRQKEALMLCHFQGHTNKQAAEALGVSVEAVESLLSRARRSLKASLAPLREGEC